MITGFNPADMYAVDHIRRVLELFPGVFSGIGEFSIHKEFVSAKVAGETASLTNPALDRILDFAGEVGLAVILHNDIDMPFAKAGRGAGVPDADEGAAAASPEDDDHLGAPRSRPRGASRRRHRRPAIRAQRSPAYREIVDAARQRPDAEARVFRYLLGRGCEVRHRDAPRPRDARPRCSIAYPDRFLFGTDNVAPADQATQLRVYELWDPVWALLTPEASLKIRKGNYERVFDAARLKVRAWERANVKPL